MGVGLLLFVIGSLAFLGTQWYVHQKDTIPAVRKNKASLNKSTNSKSGGKYRCVEIEPGLRACNTVQSYKGVKILLDKAPALPVRGCDRKKCDCKFIRHDDRRSDDRRERLTSVRQEIAGTQVIVSNKDKRTKSDRRKTQHSS